MRLLSSLALIASTTIWFAPRATAAEPAKIEAQVREIITRFAAPFQKLQTMRVAIDSETTIEQQGVKNSFRNRMQLALERPNRLAARLIEGQQALTTVCDGRRCLTEFAPVQRYSLLAAPAGFDAVMGSGSQRMINLQHGLLFVTTLFAGGDAAAAYLEDVTAARYLGEVELAGEKCHRLRLELKPMNWDIWISAGEVALLRQARPNLEAFLAEQQGGELPAGLKITATVSYKNWELDATLDPREFTIEPTVGLQRVASLFGSDDSEEVHPLVGTPAPELQLDLLAGGKLNLAAHKEKIIVLDFWATWCGPCVRALPTIAKVAKHHEKQGVAFYAVNIKEESPDIVAFLKEHELDVPVALDKTGAAATAYRANAIPQTVIVGKDGRVQVVHVGAAADLEERLTRELGALIAGQDLAAEALQQEAVSVVGLQSQWHVPGKFHALASDRRGRLVAAGERVALEFNAAGQSGAAYALRAPGEQLRLFRSTAERGADLLSFSVWQRTLAAQQAGGDLLWTHDAADGLDDVTAVDLDGDERDEVVIGFNGDGGVLALDATGKELWRFKNVSNVWHVASGDLLGDLAPELITSSAGGDIFVLDSKGQLLKQIKPACEAMHVAVFHGSQQAGPGAKGTILAAGAGDEGDTLVALGPDAQPLWNLPLADKNDVIEAIHVSASRPWAAVTTTRGQVHVVELTTGKFVGRLSLAKAVPATWLDRPEGEPLLVIGAPRQLAAYSVKNP